MLKNHKKFDELRHKKRVYVKILLDLHINILELFFKIENIENKYQGAIIYLLYHLMGEKAFLLSLNACISEKKDINLSDFINLLISCCI